MIVVKNAVITTTGIAVTETTDLQKNYVYHGNVLNLLTSLPDACADLIIADPPYSIEKDKEFGEGAFFATREAWLEWWV